MNHTHFMPAGRPLKFGSVEELQTKIESYFEECKIIGEPLTITGLAIHLGTYRNLLMDYEDKDEFSDAVKMAKQRIENAYEKRLITRGNGGDIFALKQFNWRDKVESEISGKDGGPIVVVGSQGDKDLLDKI